MADDKRMLLKRQLLKEHLNESPEGSPDQQIFVQPDTKQLPQIDTTGMTPEQIAEHDKQLVTESNTEQYIKPAVAGLAQGSTLGFSDELGGALDTAQDVVAGKLPADLMGGHGVGAKYREYQQLRQAENNKMKERSPAVYGAAELAGGLAPAALMPSVGAEQLAGRFSPQVAEFLAGKMGGAGVKLAGKAASGLAEGAPVGGTIGAGTSENTIENNPMGLLKDTGAGMEMGSLTGAGLNVAGKTGGLAMDKLGTLAEDSKFIRQLKQAYGYGKEGVNLGSGAVQDRLSTMPIDAAKEFTTRIKYVDDQLGQAVGDAVQTAQAKGVKINVDEDIQDASQQLFKHLFVDNPTLGQTLDPRTAQVLKAISARETGDLTPVEAKAMRDQLYAMKDKLAGFNSDTANFAKGLSSDLAGDVNAALKEQVPGYKDAATKFERFRSLVPETIMSKGTPEQYGKVYMGDLKNPELKLFESSKDLLSNAQLPGSGVQDSRAAMQTLGSNLKELNAQNPEAIAALGSNAPNKQGVGTVPAIGNTPESILKVIRDKSDELGMLKQAQGVDPHAGAGEYATGQLFGFARSGAGQSMSIANKLGRAAGSAGQSAPVKAVTALYGASDDALKGLATRLKADNVMRGTGEALEKALNNKDQVLKNAVLFKLMQLPEYRTMLSSDEEKANVQ